MTTKAVFPALLGAVLGVAAMLPVQAQEVSPLAGAGQIVEITGIVEAIDPATRLMTLKTPDGTFEVMHVPPEVKRIDQIKIGNKVTITEIEAVAIDIEKGKDAGSMGVVPETTVESIPGDKPAGTITEKLTIYGKVEAVDKAASRLRVRGPKKTLTLEVEDPAMLDEMAPGDGVVVTYVRKITGKVEF